VRTGVLSVRGYLCVVFYVVSLSFATPACSQTSGSSTTTIVAESSGSCIDVNGGSSQVGLGIDQWTCTGTSNQSFIFTPTPDGYYTIQPQNDSLCLDAGSGSVTTAVQIVQNVCSGGNSQKWRVLSNSDGSYTISTPDETGCFDVYAGRTANGTSLTTYACHGSNNESFNMAGFRPAATASIPSPSAFVSTMVIESSSSCVDVGGGSNQAGAGIDQWTCGGTSNQSFAFTPTSDGYYNIEPQNDSLCLDAGSGSVTTAVQIVQNTCSGATSQKWQLAPDSDGSYAITTPNGAGCFDVYAGRTANGTIIATYACHGSNNESFLLPGYSSHGSQTAAPSISPAAGTYTSPLTVTITPAVSGTPIYYTTDGSTPTAASALYSGPISLTASATVQAIAVASGASASAVVSSKYTIQTPASSSGIPVIFNYSPRAQPGDVIYVQGTNFDSTSQVALGSTSAQSGTQLSVINRVGTTWLAAQIPQTWSGAMFLSVSNSSGTSNIVKLNGAIPFNLDALQLVPGGAFRVLGRNLMMAGYTPSIIVNGEPANINLSASTQNMLVATAPTTLSPTQSAVILVDNGNGTGVANLDRVISVVAGSGDPFSLGVGWGAGFTFAGHVITVSTPCNGTVDDSANIQNAINLAAQTGGVVQLPSGTCLLANTLTMQSNVVLQGAGKDTTTLKYQSNYPIWSQGADLVGIRNFTLVNANSTIEGLLWKQNTRSFFQNVKIEEGVSHQLYLTGNQNFVVMQSDFVQSGSVDEQNPYLFTDCAGFVFNNNTSVAVDGSPTFERVHDALILDNHFTRDAVNQYEAVIITSHQFVMDFAYRTAIIGNTFDVSNGPITNTVRNDGETLLTEGGGPNRTENSGTVASATSNTISDPTNTINVNPFGDGLPENYGVAIVSGTGSGQTRELTGYASGTMQVDHNWDVIPDSTSHYASFVWGLEKTVIEGNTLSENPRGIWLYQTAVRDVDVSGNAIVNGGGIFLRTFHEEGVKQFDAMYNVRVTDNTISNSDGIWMSYVNAVFVNKDQTNFGTADTGIEIRGNNLTANNPNVTSDLEDYADREGFMNVMEIQSTTPGQLTAVPMLLGTIFQADQCLNCSTAFVIGTGDYGTVLVGNAPSSSSPNFLSDWQILGSNVAGSIGTVVE
jgi:hypothetical protein